MRQTDNESKKMQQLLRGWWYHLFVHYGTKISNHPNKEGPFSALAAFTFTTTFQLVFYLDMDNGQTRSTPQKYTDNCLFWKRPCNCQGLYF